MTDRERKYVWLTEERRVALLISQEAYFSTVLYMDEGYEYHILVPNDEIDFREEDSD